MCIYRRKGNLSKSPNHLKYWENILISRFYEKFLNMNMNMKYEYEIFKFREDKRNNVFREILKCFRKTAKFKFFAKQIIYLESPDHPLQNYV